MGGAENVLGIAEGRPPEAALLLRGNDLGADHAETEPGSH